MLDTPPPCRPWWSPAGAVAVPVSGRREAMRCARRARQCFRRCWRATRGSGLSSTKTRDETYSKGSKNRHIRYMAGLVSEDWYSPGILWNIWTMAGSCIECYSGLCGVRKGLALHIEVLWRDTFLLLLLLRKGLGRIHRPDIEQVLREKKSFTLRCMLDGIKELQGRVAQWNRFASNVSIT